MNEQCWVLAGRHEEDRGHWIVRALRQEAGRPASVDADWAWALAREEERGDVMGFAHTHPPGGSTTPSARDVRTMQAWCSALGKPLLCLIAEGPALDNPSGYLFDDETSQGRPVSSFELTIA